MKKTLLVLTAAILTISLASATDLRNIEQITPVGSQDLGVNGTLDMKSNPITGINGLNNCTADQALLGDGSCGSTGSSAEKDLTTSGGLTGGQNDVLAGTDGDVDLSIASQGVGQSELNTNIAGTGLSGGGGSALAVNWADATDLDSNGDLLTDAVQNDEILNSQVTVSSGNHLSGGGNVFLGGSTTLDVQDDFLLNSGDTMNGDLNMNGNSIENASRIYASQGSYIGQTNDYDISGNTAKWVRFANASRGRHAGIFRVRWTGAAHHGSLLFRVSEVYGNLDTSSMTMIGHDYDYYGNAKSSATKVRMVKNNTNSRVYVEVHMNNSEQWNLKMQIDQLTKSENGWNLISPRESSIPSSTPTQVMSTKGSFAVNDNQDIFKVSKNGNVGIKTSSPSTALDINGSLSVAGTECPDDEALLGDGTCGSTGGSTQNLKQVLAAGNTANQTIKFSNGIEIGDSSTTVGSNTNAVAVGKGADVSGFRALAFGYYASASENYALAFGEDASTSAYGALAFGEDASASGEYALAVGNGASASGERASAVGRNTFASGDYASAVGYEADASRFRASAFGPFADATAENAVAIGYNADAPNQYEATFGNLNGQELDVNVTGDLTVHGNSNVYGSKNFVQQVNESHEVVYTSQESPDVRAVVEDTAEVVNGTAVVELPGHFSKTVSDKKSELKVQVTPNSVNTYGLAVTNRSDDQIAVKELMGGSHSFKFDYRVTGIREGYENKTVVREIEKSENATSAPTT